jgi:hypothetical protein
VIRVKKFSENPQPSASDDTAPSIRKPLPALERPCSKRQNKEAVRLLGGVCQLLGLVRESLRRAKGLDPLQSHDLAGLGWIGVVLGFGVAIFKAAARRTYTVKFRSVMTGKWSLRASQSFTAPICTLGSLPINASWAKMKSM